MNADLSWDEVRWRDPQSLPPANNSTSINMGFHGDRSSWHSRSQDYADHELHAPVAKAAAHMNASQSFFNHKRPTTDHHDSPDDTHHSSDPPQKLAPTTQRNTEDSWTGLGSGQRDQRLDSGYRLSERQSMLDSSISRGLPSISEDRRTSPGRDHPTNTNNRLSPQAHTSLPSFAVFQRSASCADGSTADLPRIPSPGRASCRGCAERDSSIEDIAIAVSGIEEILKLHSPESITKRPDGVQSDSSGIARWVLDRLREVRLKVGLQDSQSTLPAGYGYRSHQKSDHQSSGLTRSLTPPSSSKRQSDWPEVDDTRLNKKQRISPANNEPLGCDATLRYLDDQRRASDSFQKNEPYRTYSPSHSDSWVSSGRPQQQSPSVTGRSLRPLPSPSSLANTSLKAPWTGSIAPSGSSPTISHPAPSSIHTASVSSAASQHIADLQHQITVKSLGLQTLQSEYTSLLQKFQRDRLRSQTLEKKAVAAEQEVNELTTKNEELAEQVKLLETQTEQQEKKREAERSEASREKDQWGKMLEMSGRLQVKGTEERQKLVRERDDLLQRVRLLENDAAGASCRSGECSQEKSQSQEHGSRQADGGRIEEANAVVASLKKDNDSLQARTVMLRSALERIEGQYTDILNKRRELLDQEAQVPVGIARVLKEDSDALGLKGHGRFQHFNWHDHSPDKEAQTRSTGVSSPPQQANTNTSSDSAFTKNASAQEQSLLPSIALQSDNAMLRQPTPLPHDTTSATSKEASPPRLKAVNLPKWQPPNTSALLTGSDHLANNQRRASGPSTPYPGSEVNLPQWQPAKSAASSPPSTHQTSASSPPQTLLSAFAADKTPALDYSPRFVPSAPQAAGEKSDTFSSSSSSTSMPPPPRPGAAAASWRAS